MELPYSWKIVLVIARWPLQRTLTVCEFKPRHTHFQTAPYQHNCYGYFIVKKKKNILLRQLAILGIKYKAEVNTSLRWVTEIDVTQLIEMLDKLAWLKFTKPHNGSVETYD